MDRVAERDAAGMDLVDAARAIRRWWWLVVLPPVIVFTLGVWLTSDPPFESTIRATILIPGDTEVPGSAERPELMVLDDGPIFVESHAFATMVAEGLARSTDVALSVEDVKAALSGERYSRVLTVRATRDDAAEAQAIAEAAASVLPDAVNRYLVAEGSGPATVRIIDPASPAAPADGNRWLIVAVETLAALAVGVGLALLLALIAPSSRRGSPGLADGG